MIQQALAELHKAYDALNIAYYNGSLPTPIITIQSGKNGKYYGWYGKKKWQPKTSDDESSAYDEINIGAEHMARPITNIMATLNHEMVHLFCEINEIKDTSNKGVYHNKKFKAEAEKRGLIIEQAKTIGWSVTTPTQEFEAVVEKIGIDPSAFDMFRKVSLPGQKQKAPKTVKYTCPDCEASVRGEAGLNIICGDCGVELEETEHKNAA